MFYGDDVNRPFFMCMRPKIAGITLFCYVMLLLWLALYQWGDAVAPPTWQLIPFKTIVSAWQIGGRVALINVLGNVVAFVPIGVFGRFWLQPRIKIVLLLGIVLSSLIEMLQSMLTYRVSDIDDILLNSVGCGIGIGMQMLIFYFLEPRKLRHD